MSVATDTNRSAKADGVWLFGLPGDPCLRAWGTESEAGEYAKLQDDLAGLQGLTGGPTPWRRADDLTRSDAWDGNLADLIIAARDEITMEEMHALNLEAHPR